MLKVLQDLVKLHKAEEYLQEIKSALKYAYLENGGGFSARSDFNAPKMWCFPIYSSVSTALRLTQNSHLFWLILYQGHEWGDHEGNVPCLAGVLVENQWQSLKYHWFPESSGKADKQIFLGKHKLDESLFSMIYKVAKLGCLANRRVRFSVIVVVRRERLGPTFQNIESFLLLVNLMERNVALKSAAVCGEREGERP